jgi:hypothetical protein
MACDLNGRGCYDEIVATHHRHMEDNMVTFARLPTWIIASAALTLLGSCSDGGQRSLSREPSPANLGGVEIHLDVAESQLLGVDMNVYQGSDTSGTPVISRTVSVGTPPALTAFTGSLDPGDYTVTFDGTASDGTPCFGTAGFTIVAGTTSQTGLNLTCSMSAAFSAPTGSVTVRIQIVEVTNCPTLQNVSVNPLHTSGVVSLSTDIDAPSPSTGTAHVQWRDGMSTILNGQNGTFDCTGQTGTHSLTVTATVPNSACTSSVTSDVTCGP